jgi:hypothetical protein
VEVAILIGLQASGKTTFCQRVLAADHVMVSKDAFGDARHWHPMRAGHEQERSSRARVAGVVEVILIAVAVAGDGVGLDVDSVWRASPRRRLHPAPLTNLRSNESETPPMPAIRWRASAARSNSLAARGLSVPSEDGGDVQQVVSTALPLLYSPHNPNS